MKYKIYKYTNIVNGKIYIGRTKRLNKRLKEHSRADDDCRLLNNAIKKYGIESFDIDILTEVESFDESVKLERKYIFDLNSLSPNGYNLIVDTDQGREISISTKCIMSINNQGICKKEKFTSKFIGVKKRNGLNVYRMSITKDKKEYGKYFKSEEKAAEAYDKMAIYLYGNGAKLNFPEKLDVYLKDNLYEFFKNIVSKRKNTSIYNGVSYMKNCNMWRAIYYDKKNKKQIHIGSFITEVDAKKSVDDYESKHT